MTADVNTLKACVAAVEAAIDTIESPLSMEWTAYQQAVDAFCERLRGHGAKISGSAAGPTRMTLAGISATCTSGARGAAFNWLSTARKTVENRSAAARLNSEWEDRP